MIYSKSKSSCRGREPSLGSLVIKIYERFICTKIIGEDVLLYPIQDVAMSCHKKFNFSCFGPHHIIFHWAKKNAYSGRDAQSSKKFGMYLTYSKNISNANNKMTCKSNFEWSQHHSDVKMGPMPINLCLILWVWKEHGEENDYLWLANWSDWLHIDCYWLANHRDWPMCGI
jgi:6-phosphogluconolactonase (cycloisomerase 2 family)